MREIHTLGNRLAWTAPRFATFLGLADEAADLASNPGADPDTRAVARTDALARLGQAFLWSEGVDATTLATVRAAFAPLLAEDAPC